MYSYVAKGENIGRCQLEMFIQWSVFHASGPLHTPGPWLVFTLMAHLTPVPPHVSYISSHSIPFDEFITVIDLIRAHGPLAEKTSKRGMGR